MVEVADRLSPVTTEHSYSDLTVPFVEEFCLHMVVSVCVLSCKLDQIRRTEP